MQKKAAQGRTPCTAGGTLCRLCSLPGPASPGLLCSCFTPSCPAALGTEHPLALPLASAEAVSVPGAAVVPGDPRWGGTGTGCCLGRCGSPRDGGSGGVCASAVFHGVIRQNVALDRGPLCPGGRGSLGRLGRTGVPSLLKKPEMPLRGSNSLAAHLHFIRRLHHAGFQPCYVFSGAISFISAVFNIPFQSLRCLFWVFPLKAAPKL